jgi:cytochrome c nitrite reductase small subunit
MHFFKNWNHIKFFLLFSVPVILGLGLFTFVYAKGYSYLTNDPAACANCHVMQSYYDGWIKSSHRSVAACNDCHSPHGLVPKYLNKASNGFWHSYAFTLNNYKDNLSIKESNYNITLSTCRNCHKDLIETMAGGDSKMQSDCIRCHGSVGHPSR